MLPQALELAEHTLQVYTLGCSELLYAAMLADWIIDALLDGGTWRGIWDRLRR